MQVDPIKPMLKPPGTERLKLKFEELLQVLVSKSACAATPRETPVESEEYKARNATLKAGAYTRPRFSSTSAHNVRYTGCMIFPQSIRQGDTGRCDENGLG